MSRVGRTRVLTAVATVALLFIAGCGRSADEDDNQNNNVSEDTKLTTITPAGTSEAGPITWTVYRDVQTLDPIYAFDYPDNTAVSLMCESLLRMQPDGQIADGLAKMSQPDDSTLVFDIDPAATFWDGNKVTAEDVVFSLKRQTDPNLGGFYGATFSRVDSIEATGDEQVTVKLKEPDAWLQGELASFPGIILEKSFTEAQGAKYGTPDGSIMCTGAYKLKSWEPATGVVAEANTDYWGSTGAPKTSEIVLKGAPDEAAFTNSLTTGEIQGSYVFALSTLKQLEDSDKVNVVQGPGYSTDAFVISNLDGALGDLKVRQALSMAIDRQGIIDTVYKGAALMPRWFSNPGTFGYGVSTFQDAYDATDPMSQDIDKAKELVKEAGAEGKTVTIGMSSELANISAVASEYQTAGKAIGLDVKLKSVSANNYINFFIDPKARASVDGFLTVNYGDYADPAALLATIVLPDGSQNFSGYSDAETTKLMNQARSEMDPDKRAEIMVKVEERITEQLPWIPNVQPTTVLILNKEFSGAVSSFAYMFAPWANQLGGS
ncbi:MAG: ABC transporter substrate-binding protein [Nocardioides sp.]|uniref:ABC transporter substrate-binding protein n=1 Tax=Nocardioides sp. TaxID=35761 RepID=UPI0039E50A17